MATSRQVPAALALDCIAGNPRAITVTSSGATITSPVVTVRTATGEAYTSNPPTVSQASAVTSIEWSAADTTGMNATTRPITYLWSLQALVDGDGPFELVAKTFTVLPIGSSGTSSDSSFNLTVTVGDTAIALTVTVGGSYRIAAAALPTAGATYRGVTYYVAGGTGVADKFATCLKLADNSYVWAEAAWTPIT